MPTEARLNTMGMAPLDEHVPGSASVPEETFLKMIVSPRKSTTKEHGTALFFDATGNGEVLWGAV